MAELFRLRVAVETPQHAGLAAALDYESEQQLAPGTLVRVPLGRREVPGIVWPGAPTETVHAEVKLVLHTLTALPPFSSRWCELVEFAAGYYQREIGRASCRERV